MSYSQIALNYRRGTGLQVCATCRNYESASGGCSLLGSRYVSELYTCDRYELVLTSKPAPVVPYDSPGDDGRYPLYRSVEPTEFVVRKADDEQQLVFGWANVAKLTDGTVVVDAHGDYIEVEDLEAAAYEHVLKFRATGEQHRGDVKGQLVESLMVTEEKLEAMGLAKDALPQGWWVGYRIDDDDLWESVKKGKYRSFSIQGIAEVD